MAFDVEAAIKELDLSVEDAATFRTLHGKYPKVKEFGMRQSEFDRAMNAGKAELAASKAALDQAKADVEAEVGSLATWQTEQQGKLTAAQTRLAEEEGKALKARQALEKIASEAGVDPAKYLDTTTTVVPPVVKPADVPAGVSREDLARAMLGNARTAAEIVDVNREHRKLFGEDLPNAGALLDAALEEAKRGNTNVTVTQIWEKVHGVPAKREAMRTADIDRRIEEARQAGELKGRTDAALGQNNFRNTDDLRSPVLKAAHDSLVARGLPAQGSTVSAAVADFQRRMDAIKTAT